MSISRRHRARPAALAGAAATLVLVTQPGRAGATPSTAMWAPSTPSTQADRVLHLGYDTYFATDALYGVDLGLTMGVLPWKQLQLEVGADVVYPTVANMEGLKVPVYFNAKLGEGEDLWFEGQPAWSLGIYDLGLESDVTDYDVLYGMVGKTTPIGALAVGGYYGLSDKLLVSADGKAAQAGVLASWTAPAIDLPRIDKLVFVADVQTGKNSLGGIGAGASIYFTPTIALLTGPVVFLEPGDQPGGNRWMWSAQLDVDLDLTSSR